MVDRYSGWRWKLLLLSYEFYDAFCFCFKQRSPHTDLPKIQSLKRVKDPLGQVYYIEDYRGKK